MATALGVRHHMASCAVDCGTHGTARLTAHRHVASNRGHQPGRMGLVRSIGLLRIGRIAYVVLLASAIAAVASSVIMRPEQPLPDQWSAITVGQADSLWSLAEAHAVPGLTTAQTVTLIAENNQLPSSVIMPGQTLRVPASAHEALTVASRE